MVGYASLTHSMLAFTCRLLAAASAAQGEPAVFDLDGAQPLEEPHSEQWGGQLAGVYHCRYVGHGDRADRELAQANERRGRVAIRSRHDAVEAQRGRIEPEAAGVRL